MYMYIIIIITERTLHHRLALCACVLNSVDLCAQLQDRKALEIVESLEKLQSNHYRRLYKRDRELGFSGELPVNSTILSNGKTKDISEYTGFICRLYFNTENLQEMKQRSRTLWEKLTGK